MALYEGDITKLYVDAVVNAANETLMAGGGVDGAIHAAAGPGLARELRKWNRCPTGSARLTMGHGLPAAHIIHAVGPVYADGRAGEAEDLARAYRSALDVAEKIHARTVAMPCISTGAYGFPARDAARIAIEVCEDWVLSRDLPEQIIFCTYQARDTNTYRDLGIRDHPEPERLLTPAEDAPLDLI